MMKQGIMSLQGGGEGPPQGDIISELKKRLRKIMSTYREQQRLSEQLLNPSSEWSALDDTDFLNQIDWEGMEEIEKLISQGVDIDDIEDFVNRGILTAPAEATGGGMFTDPDTKQLKMPKPDVEWGEGMYHLEGTPLTAADWGDDFFGNLTMDYFGDDAKLMGPRLRQLAETNPGAFQGLLDYLYESDEIGSSLDEMLYGKEAKKWFYPKSIVNLHDDPNVSFTEGLYRDLNQWIDRMSDEEFAEEIAQANREKRPSAASRINMDLHKALQEIKADSPVPSRGARLTGPGPLNTKLMSMLPIGTLAGKAGVQAALQAIPLGPLDALEIAVTPETAGNPEEYLGDYDSPHADLSRLLQASGRSVFDELGPNTENMDLIRSLSPTTYDSNIEDLMNALYESERKRTKPGTPILDLLRR
jgi:hypothetical protein